jgi:hypothetical protein
MIPRSRALVPYEGEIPQIMKPIYGISIGFITAVAAIALAVDPTFGAVVLAVEIVAYIYFFDHLRKYVQVVIWRWVGLSMLAACVFLYVMGSPISVFFGLEFANRVLAWSVVLGCTSIFVGMVPYEKLTRENFVKFSFVALVLLLVVVVAALIAL